MIIFKQKVSKKDNFYNDVSICVHNNECGIRDLLDAFKLFLKALGYHSDIVDRISISYDMDEIIDEKGDL